VKVKGKISDLFFVVHQPGGRSHEFLKLCRASWSVPFFFLKTRACAAHSHNQNIDRITSLLPTPSVHQDTDSTRHEYIPTYWKMAATSNSEDIGG
jgi:hypothetical protein